MENKTLVISDLPTEMLLNIYENVYIIDDLISLYKTCKICKITIDEYRNLILEKLFLYKSFSNSYYNLFISFINYKYEYLKQEPFNNLKGLLNWRHQNNWYKMESIELLNYFIELEKFNICCFIDDCFDIFKHFMYLLYIPSDYIYNSRYLLNTFYNIRSVCSSYKKTTTRIIKIQKELNYYYSVKKNKEIYTLKNMGNISIFEMLISIYPDLLIFHLLNFEKFVSPKKYKKMLHNFVINLFIEWLFENECKFIETIYYKLYTHFPQFIQRTIYRVLYNEFTVLYHITSDEFIEEFYSIHRIFLSFSKISRLYNNLDLESYRITQEDNKKDWKYNLKDLNILFN